MKAIDKAIQAAGGQQALAEKCGVRYQAVQKWARLNRIPAERVLAIETASGISRHELRPDLYPQDSAA